MSAIYFLGYLVLLAAIVKAILFWLYLWQLKEYRWDRFWADYGDREKLFRFWLWSGGRVFCRPRFTRKATLLFLAALAVFASVLFLPSRALLSSFVPLELAALLHLFSFYLLVPVIVIVIVYAAAFPTRFIKAGLYRRAERKRDGLRALLVIGITGSYGKSSTKEFVAQVLARKFKVIKTPENVNSEVGIANWFLSTPIAGVEVAVVEMGAYRRREIRRSCTFMKPHIGILTGINEQHLALFGSFDNIKKAKFELMEDLLNRKSHITLRGREVAPLALFNGEDLVVMELAKAWAGKGIIYRYPAAGAEQPGWPRHYSINLQAAAQVAQYLGMSEVEIKDAVGKITFTDRMIKTRTAVNGMFVVEDTYSANPAGVIAALDFLAIQNRKHKVIVMPSLIELGEAAAAVHERIGEKIFEVCDLGIIVTPDHFEDIRRGAGNKVVLETDAAGVEKAMARFMDRKLHRETALLLEGRLSSSVMKNFER